MRPSQAKSKTLQHLLPKHRIYDYTINDEKKKNKLHSKYQVAAIYTDFLPSGNWIIRSVVWLAILNYQNSTEPKPAQNRQSNELTTRP